MSRNGFARRLSRLSASFQEAKVLSAGVSLGVFDHLSTSGPTTAEALSTALGGTLRGFELMLDALSSLGYLEKSAAAYSNSADAQRHLVRGRPESLAYIMAHRSRMFHSWATLEEVILHGQQVREEEKESLRDPESNRAFILGMAEVSRERVGKVLDRLPLERAELLVDLGGGPGHYACDAVRRHSGLRALLVDLPLTVEVGKQYIRSQGLEGRVETLVCDFYHEERLDFGELADLVLVSQVLHAEGPDQNRGLLKRLRPLVRPGGWVVVNENLVRPDRCSPPEAALFAVNMLACTERGRTYTAAEISGWLREAGLDPGEAIEAAERSWLILAKRA